MSKLYVIGIGPGGLEHITMKAAQAIKKCEVIVGYKFYIELIEELITGKRVISTGMKGELERCRLAIDEVKKGFDTCIVSTGDPGLYGMAGPILEMADDIEVEVIPGVSAAFCAASELGAPIMHDFCAISFRKGTTPLGLIKNAGRIGNEKRILTLETVDFEFIDMMTVVIIGNSKTFIKDGKIITPRGYDI
jgi:precorrin-3B C17-methyltransferase